MHICYGKKERIRFHFISLLTSIKSQSPRATDLCIHARFCRTDKKCNEIKQKQKTKKIMDSFIIYLFYIYVYTPEMSTPRQSTQRPPLSGFAPVVFIFFAPVHIRLHFMYFIHDGVQKLFYKKIVKLKKYQYTIKAIQKPSSIVYPLRQCSSRTPESPPQKSASEWRTIVPFC